MTSSLVTQAQRLRTALGYRTGQILNRLAVAVENRRSTNHNGVVILDDMFPSMLTSFRLAEFNIYLEQFDDVRIYSTAGTFRYWIKEYSRYYPQFKNSIQLHNDHRRLRGKGAYMVFLHNAFRFLANVEQAGLPFVFVLY